MPEIKVEYRSNSGYQSKAYITEEPDENGQHPGVNKHSDAPVIILNTNEGWVELDTPEYRAASDAWWADKRNWM